MNSFFSLLPAATLTHTSSTSPYSSDHTAKDAAGQGLQHFDISQSPAAGLPTFPAWWGSEGQAVSSRQRVFWQLHEALELLPLETKAAYLEACVVCPHLVETESNPLRFLVCEDFNTWAAALRLAQYWKTRRELFGARAFLPMDLSGQGAMAEEDIEFVKTGIAILAPFSSNNVVAVVDRTRLRGPLPENGVRYRREFFLMQALSENPVAQREGFMALLNIDRAVSSFMPPPSICQYLKGHVIPVRFHTFHLLCYSPASRSLAFLSDIIPLVLKSIGLVHMVPRALVHCCDSMQEGYQKLLQHGFLPEGIPTNMGGKWTYEHDFVEWLVQRGARISPTLLETPVKPAPTSLNHDAPTELQPQNHLDISTHSTQVFESAPLAAEEAEAALKRVFEALGALPHEDTSAYIEAMERVPYLVETESSPLRFLRFCKGDPLATARRIAAYWKNRIRIFGDRGFRPLTQSKEGALCEEDIKEFKNGTFVFLPRDDHGRTVICYDPSRRVDSDPALRLRISFYVGSIIAENEESQAEGYSLIVILNGQRLMDGVTTQAINTFMESFPTQLVRCHLVTRTVSLEEKDLFAETLLLTAIKVMGKAYASKTVIHAGSSEQILSGLTAHGLQVSGIPETAGGEWRYASFADWVENRRLAEMDYYDVKLAAQRVNLADKARRGSIGSVNTAISFEARQRNLAALEEAIERLETPTNAVYLEAKKRSREVLERDLLRVGWLRHQVDDLALDAERVVQYWQKRYEIFGDSAFLPLDQTGDGCLDKAAIQNLSSSFLMQLPNDSHGRAVICCDYKRLGKLSRESILRCSFYLLSVACENPLSRREGFNLIYVLSDPNNTNRLVCDCLKSVFGSVPARVRSIYLVGLVSEYCDASMLQQAAAAALSDFGANYDSKAVVRVGSCREDVAQFLAAEGLTRQSLPRSIGGDFNYEQFVHWQELRTRMEWDLPISPGSRALAQAFGLSAPLKKDMDAMDPAERKRRMNVIHSRRRRERERMEVEWLDEQCFDLRETKQRLKLEEKRLEALLNEAQAMVTAEMRRTEF